MHILRDFSGAGPINITRKFKTPRSLVLYIGSKADAQIKRSPLVLDFLIRTSLTWLLTFHSPAKENEDSDYNNGLLSTITFE